MSLSTFGAVMGFAAEIVAQTENIYRILIQKAKKPAIKETFESLLSEAGKNKALMEQMRRENVTEMILEPISGLEQEDYQINLTLPDSSTDIDFLKMAMILEKREKRFFQDASSKVPLPEVARIFKKIAQKKEGNLERLHSLGIN